MKKTKKIAVIYYNAGLGHLREALAVRDILKKQGLNPELVDFDSFVGGLFSKIGNIYEKMQKNGLSLLLSLSWWKTPPDFLVKTANRIERNKEKEFTAVLEKYLLKNKFDSVVTTHFFPAGALSASKTFREKTINICVDNMWKNSAWIYAVPGIKTIVPTQESYDNIYLDGKLGVEKEDLILAGHPFPPELLKEKNKMHNNRIKKYNTKEPLNLLVTTGGAGTNEKEMFEIISGGKELILKNKVNVVLWCNHHQQMGKRLKEKSKSFGLGNYSNLKILSTKTKIEAVYGLHEQIRKCDLLVTKPGELAMYGGLAPLYLFDPTSSQEYSLADFAYIHKYAIDVKKIGAKNLLSYADSHREELVKLSEDGMRNPLIKMQEENILLFTIKESMNKK